MSVNVGIKPTDMKKVLFFAESMAKICSRTQVAQGRPLRWLVIANPNAGGFRSRSRWARNRLALEDRVAQAGANYPHKNCGPADTAARFGNPSALARRGLVATERAGSATEIAGALLTEISKARETANDASAPFYLVIIAGGDGTGLEALSVLFNAPEETRSSATDANMAVLRLPMGTGNDGADSHDLTAALDLLIRPARIEFAPALRMSSAPGGLLAARGPLLAFNVLSLGLDAFVTHMANKTKKKTPGDFYKLWVDIAALLYDRLYAVDFLDVKALGEDGEEVSAFREKLLLIAMGASGRRTYGSRKKILPDERNVCALRQMPLLKKLAFKGLFSTGAHADKPEATLFNARRLEISGERPILAQTDGETVLLQKEDFPIAVELTAPTIPVLRPS